MTKAQLDAAEAALTTTGLVTKARVNTYTGSLGDEVYPDTIIDNQATTNLITKANNNFNYTFTFWKSGRTIFFTCIIRNATFGNLSAQDIATGLTGQFAPAAVTYLTGFDNSTTNKFNMSFNTDGSIKLITALNTQNDFVFNGHYPAAN